jgi:hypothetical protein
MRYPPTGQKGTALSELLSVSGAKYRASVTKTASNSENTAFVFGTFQALFRKVSFYFCQDLILHKSKFIFI